MFKLIFLKMRTAFALKKTKVMRSSIPFKQAHTVGIIFSVEDKQKHEDIKEFIRLLEQDGKKVKVLEFLPHKKENYEFLFDFFTSKDLSFSGKITSPEAIQFGYQQFDYLYYVDLISNPLVMNLLANCKAHCRVGRFLEKESAYYELMIEHTGTTKGMIHNMFKYSKELR